MSPFYSQTHNYVAARGYEALLDQLGDREELLFTKTTSLHRIAPDALAFRYHETDIATFYEDGAILLCNGGFYNKMCLDKINEPLPKGVRVFVDARYWYVHIGVTTFPFFEGMLMNHGTVENYGSTVMRALERQRKENERYKAQIRKYTDKLTSEKAIAALSDTSGDCIGCRMVVGENATLDELHGDGHLIEHMKDGYYPGLLLLRAQSYLGYGDNFMWYFVKDDIRGVQRALEKYMQKRLLKGLNI